MNKTNKAVWALKVTLNKIITLQEAKMLKLIKHMKTNNREIT